MDDLLDMIIDDESPSSISDKIKDLLFAKSSKKSILSDQVLHKCFWIDAEEQISDKSLSDK